MAVEMRIPNVPQEENEELVVARWLVENGATVEKNQKIAEIENLVDVYTVPAEENGMLIIVAHEGAVVKEDDVLCYIKEIEE